MADATLVLARSKAYVDKVRAYKIMLDGQEIGRIKEGTEESAHHSGREPRTAAQDRHGDEPGRSLRCRRWSGGQVRLQAEAERAHGPVLRDDRSQELHHPRAPQDPVEHHPRDPYGDHRHPGRQFDEDAETEALTRFLVLVHAARPFPVRARSAR